MRDAAAAWSDFAENHRGCGFILCDCNGRVTAWNSGAEELLGYTAAEAQGKSWASLLEPGKSPDAATQTFFHKDGARRRLALLTEAFPAGSRSEGGFSAVIHRLPATSDVETAHHRIRNSLQTILSLIDLQAVAIQAPRSRQAVTGIRGRVQTVAALYERAVMDLSSGELRLLPLIEFLGTDVKELWPQAGDIKLERDVAGLSIADRRALPFALIAHELLSNAFRHAFEGRRTGVVQVRLQATNGQSSSLARLEVSDNGCGMPDGIKPDTAPSSGFQMIRMLRGQLDGTLACESGGGGTKVVLDFSLREKQ